jgi:hypothetical protein
MFSNDKAADCSDRGNDPGDNGCCRHGQAENLSRTRGRGRAADRHDFRRGAPAAGGHAHASGHGNRKPLLRPPQARNSATRRRIYHRPLLHVVGHRGGVAEIRDVVALCHRRHHDVDIARGRDRRLLRGGATGGHGRRSWPRCLRYSLGWIPNSMAGFWGGLRGGTAALQHRAHRRLPSDAV